MKTRRRNRSVNSLAVFVIAQVLLGGTLAAWAGWRVADERAARALPEPRQTPLVIGPLYDYPPVVSDEQLAMVLTRLRPRGDRPTAAAQSTVATSDISAPSADPATGAAYLPRINHVDHGLRCWGTAARFDEPGLLGGEAMRKLLTDHREFARVYGNGQAPLLMDAGPGVRVRVGEGPASSSHVDHTLACLAEVGTPLDFLLVTPTRATTYRALLEQSLRDFSLNQHEYEWSALTYALFLPHVDGWRTSEGQWITFDALAGRLMREEWPRGVCFGNHRLFTLTVFLRVDEWRQAELGTPLVSPAMRTRIVQFLADATTRLVAHQHALGCWNADWPTTTPADQLTGGDGDRLADRVLATGHALEWWAIAPEELHPPREVLIRGGQWLVRTVEEMSPPDIEENYTYLSHVGRALALWRRRPQ